MRKTTLWLAALALTAVGQAANAQFQIKGAVSKGTAITTVTQAQQLLSGTIANNGVLTGTSPVINFLDPKQQDNPYSYHFQNKTPFIVDNGTAQNNFSIQADASLMIPKAGTYTFGVNSDDGFSLNINGTVIQNPTQRPAADTLGAITFASAGNYPLDLIYFQNLGQASLELYASPGSYTAYGASGSNFQLIGGSGTGALQVASATGVPEPASIGVLTAAGVLLLRRRR